MSVLMGKLEQLRMYQLLVDQLSQHTAVFPRPLVKPLFHLLVSCSEHENSDVIPAEVEKKLVTLLNSLARCLCQNLELLDIFFVPESLTSTEGWHSLPVDNEMNGDSAKSRLSPSLSVDTSSPLSLVHSYSIKDRPEAFLIFALLIPFVHREGTIGDEARDGLLKIMAVSRQFDFIAKYIANESDFCPVLATGLSGIFSSLPRKIKHEEHDGWCTLTPEDVQEMPVVQQFLTSLKFCDAVIEEAHPLIQKQLVNYVYRGFLISVIGPALLQNSFEEMIATTTYLELFLRQVTQPSLLQVFLRAICLDSFDGQRILSALISRIKLSSKLSIVTLVLFRRMIDLCCEDVLLELIFKYLMKGQHLRTDKLEKGDRKQIDDVEKFGNSSETLISLLPVIPVRTSFSDFISPVTRRRSKCIEYSSLACPPVTLENYFEYLSEARFLIYEMKLRTCIWSEKYNSSCLLSLRSGPSPTTFTPESPGSDRTCSDSGVFLQPNNNHLQTSNDQQNQNINASDEQVVGGTPTKSANHVIKSSSPSTATPTHVPPTTVSKSTKMSPNENSSPSTPVADFKFLNRESDFDCLNDRDDHANTQAVDKEVVGPFLSALFSKLEDFSTNDIYTNLQLTGIISRLCCYPHPLLRSYLLNFDLPLSSNCPSLITSLFRAKEDIEQKSKTVDRLEERLTRARMFFTSREELFLSPDFLYYVHDHYSLPAEAPRGSRVSMESKAPTNRRRSIMDMIFKGRSSSTSNKSGDSSQSLPPVLEVEAGKVRYRNRSSTESESSHEDEKRKEETADRIAFSVLLFSEFVKELSAITQEQMISFEA